MIVVSENETYPLRQGDQTFQKVNIYDNFKEEKIGFFQKIKVEKGSIAESVINICIICYAIGLLALPTKGKWCYFGNDTYFNYFFGIVNYWTFTVLTDASRKYKIDKYEDIVSTLFSP